MNTQFNLYYLLVCVGGSGGWGVLCVLNLVDTIFELLFSPLNIILHAYLYVLARLYNFSGYIVFLAELRHVMCWGVAGTCEMFVSRFSKTQS